MLNDALQNGNLGSDLRSYGTAETKIRTLRGNYVVTEVCFFFGGRGNVLSTMSIFVLYVIVNDLCKQPRRLENWKQPCEKKMRT